MNGNTLPAGRPPTHSRVPAEQRSARGGDTRHTAPGPARPPATVPAPAQALPCTTAPGTGRPAEAPGLLAETPPRGPQSAPPRNVPRRACGLRAVSSAGGAWGGGAAAAPRRLVCARTCSYQLRVAVRPTRRVTTEPPRTRGKGVAPAARTPVGGGAAPLQPGNDPKNHVCLLACLLLPSPPRLPALYPDPTSLRPSCPSRYPCTSHPAHQPRSARLGLRPYLGQVFGAPGLAGGQQRGGPQEGVGQQLQARALALDELHLRLAQLRQVRVGFGSQVKVLGPAGAKGTRRHAYCPLPSTHGAPGPLRPREGSARLSKGTRDSDRAAFLAVHIHSLRLEKEAAPGPAAPAPPGATGDAEGRFHPKPESRSALTQDDLQVTRGCDHI